MAKQTSNAYTLGFAASVTLVCSVLLASAATLLKPMQEQNIQLDIKYNILSVLDLLPEQELEPEALLSLYDNNVQSLVVNTDGDLVTDRSVYDLDPKVDLDLLPIYTKEQDGVITAYCIPISGKGLWSTIKGYIALEQDLTTVKGITFYAHGETPGLGGEIDKDWFTANYIGKQILNESGELVSVNIAKGQVRPDEKNPEHMVDGMSGATLTGNGINNFLKATLEMYEPYFQSVRGVES